MNDQNLAFRVCNCAFQSTMGPSRFQNFWLTGKKVWFGGFGLVLLMEYKYCTVGKMTTLWLITNSRFYSNFGSKKLIFFEILRLF